MNKIKTQKTKKGNFVTRNGDLVTVQVQEPNFWWARSSKTEWSAEDTATLSGCYKAVTEKLAKQYAIGQLTISAKAGAVLEITVRVKQCPQLLSLMSALKYGPDVRRIMRGVSYNDVDYTDLWLKKEFTFTSRLRANKRHEVAA